MWEFERQIRNLPSPRWEERSTVLELCLWAPSCCSLQCQSISLCHQRCTPCNWCGRSGDTSQLQRHMRWQDTDIKAQRPSDLTHHMHVELIILKKCTAWSISNVLWNGIHRQKDKFVVPKSGHDILRAVIMGRAHLFFIGLTELQERDDCFKRTETEGNYAKKPFTHDLRHSKTSVS